MSVNWSKTDLAARLRTELVSVEEIVPGDVALSDGHPFGVERVDAKKDVVMLYDEDENGFGAKRGNKMFIIARDALKPWRKK